MSWTKSIFASVCAASHRWTKAVRDARSIARDRFVSCMTALWPRTCTRGCVLALVPAFFNCASKLDMAAWYARLRASEHRRVHIYVRQVVVEVERTAGLVARNVTPEISTGHGPVEVVRRAAAQRSRWCVTRKKRPLNLVPCAKHAEVVQFLDLVAVAVQGHGGEGCVWGAPLHPRGLIDGTTVVRSQRAERVREPRQSSTRHPRHTRCLSTFR